MKWTRRADSPHRCPERINMFGQQAAVSLQQVYCEEISSAVDAITTIVGHMQIIPRSFMRRKAQRFSALPY